MSNFLHNLNSMNPGKGQIALFWLGQAGFVIKTSSGKLIAIDPYLSDYVQRTSPEFGLGFKRLMPAPCLAEELHLDYLLISHEHGDHYDKDSIDALMRSKDLNILTTPTVAKAMEDEGRDISRVDPLHPGEAKTFESFSVLGVDCDHGELSKDALGFILDFGFISVYYAGDTALNMERLKRAVERKPDIAILPINGAFGNLDGIQAAELAGALQPRYCVPCHFWTFPLHMGNPQQMIDHLPTYAENCELCLFQQGEGMIFPR
ncbi:MAG: MBL fold metallo-hydrolase [Christensenellales bacterium]|jgi:L-ascorbate 6-phosphate lactonase